MSERIGRIIRLISRAQNLSVIEVNIGEPKSEESDVIRSYRTLVDVKSLLTLLARRYTVQWYREQGRQVPTAGQIDTPYSQYYLMGIIRAMADSNGLNPYWTEEKRLSSPVFHTLNEVDQVDQTEAEKLSENLFDSKIDARDWKAPLHEVMTRFAHSLKGADPSGTRTMNIILVSIAVPLKPDPSDPSHLVHSPTFTAVYLELSCEEANGGLAIQITGQALVARLDARKVDRDRAKIQQLLQDAVDGDLDLPE